MTIRPSNRYTNYHAHLYFDKDSAERASFIGEEAKRLFSINLGRVHRKLLGPHPNWSCQLAFNCHQFNELIPWLEMHRGGLSILVHGLTGEDLSDHTKHASWLGKELNLKLEYFSS